MLKWTPHIFKKVNFLLSYYVVVYRGSCPPPPVINNGYFLSERYSGEKPYVLPVSGSSQQTYEVVGPYNH
jgi:hypothetical protein